MKDPKLFYNTIELSDEDFLEKETRKPKQLTSKTVPKKP